MSGIATLYVFIGGGLGAVTRYLFSIIISKPSSGFPLATFSANVVSSLFLGLLLGYFLHSKSETKLLWVTGFCGGFSTFSTFSAETFQLIKDGNYIIAISYVLLSILVCLVGIAIGFKISS